MDSDQQKSGAIVIDRLTKRYGRHAALQEVSFRVRQGEIFGLLGANGAGKTTLIKTLVGATLPSAGSVGVLGLDPRHDRRALRRQIGYMPQAPALYDDLSARDNVRFFAQAHRIEHLERRIDEALALVDLNARAREPVHRLSGGMRQRVSLACALVHRPPLLLLDEPTAGVDLKLRANFWDHFRALAADGATLLVSTHQLDEALLCDRVAILREGVLLACEDPRKLTHGGRATITIHYGDDSYATTLNAYPDQLPLLLQRYGLDPAVSRIEIAEETLDAVVLRMIAARESTAESLEEPDVVHA